MNDTLTHFDASGHAYMVDVGDKAITHRVAVAEGYIQMKRETLEVIKQGTANKGDVLGVARIAAVMGAKKTSELIPLCHAIALTRVAVEFEFDDELPGVKCKATVGCRAQTGVEMEALTAVQIGLLTVYDMCKAIDQEMLIKQIFLTSKTGGRSRN